MQKHFCGIGEQEHQEHTENLFCPTGKSIANSLGEVMAMSNEMEEKLAQIKAGQKCPKPCGDGTVEISMSYGSAKRTACPVITQDCRYGERMKQELERYITGVMADAGVPLRHLENFTDTHKTEPLAEVGKWEKRGFLIFTGSTGSGKSFGAALAVFKCLKSLIANPFDRKTWKIAEADRKTGSSVIWCSSMDLSDDRETVSLAKRAKLAVIDDFGGEADTPAGQTVLRGVILRRHDMKLPTVITTALTMLDIDIRYGGRVADRLIEDVGKGGKIIECGNFFLLSLPPMHNPTFSPVLPVLPALPASTTIPDGRGNNWQT